MAPSGQRRWPWALALLVLSPVCAEYLWGYDDTTGDAAVLIGGLIIFSPLYGAPALLIREAAVRLGLRWPGILLLAAAAGLIEAGLVDQSMFSINYRDIPYWDDITVPTAIGPLGISVYTALTFVGGHVVLSFGAPIAVVQGLSGDAARRPWLGRVGLVVTALVYVAACALVLGDHLSSESDHASLSQVVVTSVVALLLVAAAVATKRLRRDRVPGEVPAPWLMGLGTLAVTGSYTLLPPSAVGTAVLALVAVAVTVVLVRLSLRSGWTDARTVAVAGGALVAAGVGAFWTDPLGDVPALAKYAHNVILVALVAGLTVWATQRTRPTATW
jgi:uncharacterized membrane protein YhaH (DUF805 family)